MFLLPIYFLFFEHGFEQGFEHGFEQGVEHGFEHGFEYDFEHGFELGSEHAFERGLNMILNMVLNMNSSRIINLISTKQFNSFSFYIASFSRLVLDFILRYSLTRVNVSNSNKISEYSSSEMDPSENAFEMRLLMVLSDEIANIAIFSCVSIFNDIFFIA